MDKMNNLDKNRVYSKKTYKRIKMDFLKLKIIDKEEVINHLIKSKMNYNNNNKYIIKNKEIKIEMK